MFEIPNTCNLVGHIRNCGIGNQCKEEAECKDDRSHIKVTSVTHAKCNNCSKCCDVVLVVEIRDFKQIATAGANTAAGSKFPPK